MKRILSLLICILIIFPIFSIDVSAGKATVVYLRDGGKGDGSSVSKAVGSLTDAYNALDLTKDCTIVVCNDFNQPAHFEYGKPYTGSVRFTSVYNGVDYSKKYGAEFISKAQRFVLYGKTVFDDIDLRLTGNYFFIIANCNPVTLTENFNPIYENQVTGNVIDSGVSILGGYQSAQDMYPLECYNDINITVMGGKNICIAANNRAVKHGYHFGTANITVGGNAHVGTIRFASIDADDLISGDINITVKDSARVDYIRTGNGKNLDVNSLVVNWQGGTVVNFIPFEEYEVDGVKYKNTDFTEGTLLRYSGEARRAADFKEVYSLFDRAVLIGSPNDVPVTDKADSTSAEVTEADLTDNYETAETAPPADDDNDGVSSVSGDNIDLETALIIFGSAVIAVSLIVIVIILRRK